MKKSIAFDLDGTLLDSKFRHQKVLYDILKEEGYSIRLSDLDDFISYKCGGKNTKEYLKSKYYDSVNVDKIWNEWIENIEKIEYINLDILYEHTINLLKNLSDIYDLYLVTVRKNKENTIKQLANHDIIKYFKEVYIVLNNENSALNKYNETKNLGIELVIGDTEVDLKWAEYLKAKFLPVSYGFRDIKWWEAKNMRAYNQKELEKKIKEFIEL